MDRYIVEYYLDDGDWFEWTYDEVGNEISYKDSIGFWGESTFDNSGREITYKGGKI